MGKIILAYSFKLFFNLILSKHFKFPLKNLTASASVERSSRETLETRAAAQEDLSRLAPSVACVVIFYYKTSGITQEPISCIT